MKVGSAEGAGLAGSEVDGGADDDGAVAVGEAVTGSVGEAVGVAVALVVAGWVCAAVGAAEVVVGVGAGGPKQPASANMAPTPRTLNAESLGLVMMPPWMLARCIGPIFKLR